MVGLLLQWPRLPGHVKLVKRCSETSLFNSTSDILPSTQEKKSVGKFRKIVNINVYMYLFVYLLVCLVFVYWKVTFGLQ